MRNLITIILTLIFTTQVGIAQHFEIDSCGLTTVAELNKHEADYFNKSLEKQRKNFDFKNKKVAFAYGNFGKSMISKKEYFDEWGRDYFKNDIHVANILYTLNSEEKELSGGYDAIIISWAKVIRPKDREKIVKKLIIDGG